MSDADWRLTGQEEFLTGVTLERRVWQETRPDWDHDHCAFCGAKFAAIDEPDILHEGWTTDDEYYWICDACFADFREQFGWSTPQSR
jgi:hypothetical protein